MSTLNSGTSSWLPVVEFCKRTDPRVIADLVSDNNTRPYQNNDGSINVTLLAADPNLNAILMSACGRLEADLFVGNRYAVADLALIAQGPASNTQAFLYTLITRIAKFDTLERRLGEDPEFRVPEWYRDTKEMLARLRNGDAIFGLLEVAEAGGPIPSYMAPEDWQAINTTVSQASAFFGRRNKDFRRPGPF